MESTFQELGNLLVQAVPTILFFVFLTVYLQAVFFKPLGRILEERRRSTEGVRELAHQAMESADRKTSEFEYALQLARGQIHQENEALRRKWAEEEQAALAQARTEADQEIQRAKNDIGAEADRAQAELDATVQELSERITASLLRRRAA